MLIRERNRPPMKRAQGDVSMRGDGAQRLDHLGLDQVARHEHEQVREVAPARARSATLERGHELLGDDHRLGVG